MGSVSVLENTVGENLIRRSHRRKDVEQTGADATLCKQSETRHRDASLPLDQSAHKLNVEHGVSTHWHERQGIKTVFHNEPVILLLKRSAWNNSLTLLLRH